MVNANLERRTPRTVTGPGLLRKQLEGAVETGVAFEHEESAVGVVCVAAPVLAAYDTPTAAVSVSGPITRFRPEAHVASLRAVVAGIGGTLARRAQMLGD